MQASRQVETARDRWLINVCCKFTAGLCSWKDRQSKHAAAAAAVLWAWNWNCEARLLPFFFPRLLLGLLLLYFSLSQWQAWELPVISGLDDGWVRGWYCWTETIGPLKFKNNSNEHFPTSDDDWESGDGGRKTAALCPSPWEFVVVEKKREEGRLCGFCGFLALPHFKYKAATHANSRANPLSQTRKTDRSLCVCVCHPRL